MSTRSGVMFRDKDGHLCGVYCHWDGYPTCRGQEIWEIVKEFEKPHYTDHTGIDGNPYPDDDVLKGIKDQDFMDRHHAEYWEKHPEEGRKHIRGEILRTIADIYIKGHKGGWSSFPKSCHCHDPYFVARDGIHDDSYFEGEDISMLDWCEWFYVLDYNTFTLEVYVKRLGDTIGGIHVREGASKTGKAHDLRFPEHVELKTMADLQLLAEVDLAGEEPDWQEIQDLADQYWEHKCNELGIAMEETVL